MSFVCHIFIDSHIVALLTNPTGAQQAGDMMQDLKTGHLLGGSPRAQFLAQLIGSAFSIVVAVGAYELYKVGFPQHSSEKHLHYYGVDNMLDTTANHLRV